jgi:hypothetical protein
MQFPQPIQRLDSADARYNDAADAKRGAEHALRRKTPNGTLAAGYDGTPGDRAIQPPAMKHILVSSLESGQLPPPQPTLSVDSWQPVVVDQTPSLQYQNFPSSYKPDASRTTSALPSDHFQGSGTGPSWVRSLNYQPGMDSVLHQTVPMPSAQRYYLHHGPSVPTVLPAALQPCLGPTAPVGTGPYGPYWPDGAYIPYRPAALRDARFIPSSSFSTGHNAPQLYDLQQPPFGHTSFPSALSNSALAWNLGAATTLNSEPLLHQNFPSRHGHQNSSGEVKDPQHNLPFHVRAGSALNANVSTHPTGDAIAWHSSLSAPPTVPEASARAQSAEFKERILSWAHGVYVDLLATLHHARKQSISKSAADGQPQKPLKPNIYPKPPRQPGLDFSASHSDIPRHHSYPFSTFDVQSQAGRQVPMSGPMCDQRSELQSLDGMHTIRRASGTSIAKSAGLLPKEGSTMAHAASALEMLSNLCMESGWEWIDGMLLGGCLAYGLGDYQKAMRWYSRILARDATYGSYIIPSLVL